MRGTAAITLCCLLGGASEAALAAPCGPNALGTSRTVTVNPAALPRIGTIQYPRTLPLNDREVVFTFDDGPLPPATGRVLAILAAECVKATFFLVGQKAAAYPEFVRRIHAEGHTIGTHSQHHPLSFNRMSASYVTREVRGGIGSAQRAAGDARVVAPYFRIPGLLRSPTVERVLDSHALSVWSADVVADDWHRAITSRQIVDRAVRRLEAKGRGVLLLHDIHPKTATALPVLLKELKRRGFRVVHVVPPTPVPRPQPSAPLVAEANKPAQIVPPIRHTRTAVLKKRRHTGDVLITASIAKKKRVKQTASAGSENWLSFRP